VQAPFHVSGRKQARHDDESHYDKSGDEFCTMAAIHGVSALRTRRPAAKDKATAEIKSTTGWLPLEQTSAWGRPNSEIRRLQPEICFAA